MSLMNMMMNNQMNGGDDDDDDDGDDDGPHYDGDYSPKNVATVSVKDRCSFEVVSLCISSVWHFLQNFCIKWLLSHVHVHFDCSYRHGCFLKWGHPQIIYFNRNFHYKPSILGYFHLWKP